MQVPKRHFPSVGLVAIVLIAATGGSIYYYQFVLPHNPSCGVPVHRVIFLTAVIQEVFGFRVVGAATVNQTAPLPAATNSTSPAQFNLTGVQLNWYNSSITDPKTITANQGDTVTVYMVAINSTDPRQYTVSGAAQGHGHGFGIDGYPIRILRLVDYGTWGGTTFSPTDPGSFTYRCEHLCSDGHSSMIGSMVVTACG